MKKPIIGIVLNFVPGLSERYVYSKFPWYVLRQNYADSIARAGGVPIFIPYTYNSIEDMLNLIDGLVIPGGDDIDPKIYGEKIESDQVILNSERDNFELSILKKALERDIPFLGICRGMQLLNVLCGGSLFQHLPDKVNGIDHKPSLPANAPSHKIIIQKGTILSELVSCESTMVTSSHHQAVNKLGNNLKISATAPDGVIEAIELMNSNFVVGVQWHPEYLSTELDLLLFERFIKSCKVVL